MSEPKHRIVREATRYGFRFGAADFERLFIDSKSGATTTALSTPKHPDREIQIYVTRTGKVRIFSNAGEWKPCKGEKCP